MNDRDELRELWQSEPAGRTDMEMLLERVQEQSRRFDRRVKWSNVAETTAGLLGTVYFAWKALQEPHPILQAAAWALAASGVWISLYLWRWARAGRAPEPDRTVKSYSAALVEKYDRRIRLLKSAKWWYLLPIYAGLMLFCLGLALKVPSMSRHTAGMAALFTAFFGYLWWLNEVKGVRELRRLREETAELEDGD
jgi:hypothetical protein